VATIIPAMALAQTYPSRSRPMLVLQPRGGKHTDDFECRYQLELDRGAKDGLAAGMDLLTTGVSAGHRITLEQTTPARAVATVSLFGDECTKPDDWPSTRTRFTTGAFEGYQPNRKAIKKEP